MVKCGQIGVIRSGLAMSILGAVALKRPAVVEPVEESLEPGEQLAA